MEFDDFFKITYFWGSIIVVAGVLPRAVLLGLVLSPVAGAITWWLARRQGLHGKRSAVAGAVYSALFLGPWIYFTLRLVGKTPPKWIVGFSYTLLYLVWSMPIFVLALLDNLARDDRYLAEEIGHGKVTWVAGLGLLLTSLLVLTLSSRFERLRGSGVLIGAGYIMPFIGLWVSTVAAVVYFRGPTGVLSYFHELGRSFGWW